MEHSVRARTRENICAAALTSEDRLSITGRKRARRRSLHSLRTGLRQGGLCLVPSWCTGFTCTSQPEPLQVQVWSTGGRGALKRNRKGTCLCAVV